MKLSKIVWISLIIIIIIVLDFIYLLEMASFVPVKEAITLDEAKEAVDNNSNYVILNSGGGNFSAPFVIEYGRHAGMEVDVMVHSPFSQLSSVFFLSKPNRFLVLGSERNIENMGKDYMETHPNAYAIEVEQWEIISPILRDYQYKYDEDVRFFAPRKFLDQFDVDHGDYIP